MKSEYELQREVNIKRNRELLDSLNLSTAAATVIGPLPAFGARGKNSTVPSGSTDKRKPVQETKRGRRVKDPESVGPRRQSTRLRKEVIDPNESPSKKRKREEELKRRQDKEEEERRGAEEAARAAKRPRHQDLDVSIMNSTMESGENSQLMSALQVVTQLAIPRRVGDVDAFVFTSNSDKEEREVRRLREELADMRVVARAKVTQDRIYSAAYHPTMSKNLVFFGDKHGQLGIWDATAPIDEVLDVDGEPVPGDEQARGKVWRLQPHWPATSKSSISCVKFDATDSHSVYTSAYDCSLRRTSFGSTLSTEIFFNEDVLISSFDFHPNGHEMWISDTGGGLTHLDQRVAKEEAIRYELAGVKIGCISVNPTTPWNLLTASNDRTLKLWDSRMLADSLPIATEKAETSSGVPKLADYESVQSDLKSPAGKRLLRSNFDHPNSVSSAYWDPRGRSIVSTSYDDNLRIWDLQGGILKKQSRIEPFNPIAHLSHNCQTGRWLTVFKATWSPNPDVFPHFTIGNMKHSLDIFSLRGDLVARLSDNDLITAVQAVTCSHPGILARAASGNGSGRCVLWGPADI